MKRLRLADFGRLLRTGIIIALLAFRPPAIPPSIGATGDPPGDCTSADDDWLGRMILAGAGPGDSVARLADAHRQCFFRLSTSGGRVEYQPQLVAPWPDLIQAGDLLTGSLWLRRSPGVPDARIQVVFQRQGLADNLWTPALVEEWAATAEWQVREFHFRAPVGYNGSSGNPAQLALNFGRRDRPQSVDVAGFRLINLGQARPDGPSHPVLAGFRRGVNLGNILEYAECPPSRQLPDTDFAAIRREGFDHVRIPVAWHHRNGPGPEFTIDPCRGREADRMVTRAMEAGLAVVLNLHHFEPFIRTDPVGQTPRFVALWRQIAVRYAGLPGQVIFELLNEPFDFAGTDDDLNAAYAEALQAIRETGGNNATRLVLLCPAEPRRTPTEPYVAHWQRLASLHFPDADPHIAATVHNYDPFLFTHQGTQRDASHPEGWTSPAETSTTGVLFPGPPSLPLPPDPRVTADWARDWFAAYNAPHNSGLQNPSSAHPIQRFTDTVLAWSLQSGRAIYVGEFGAYQAADPSSRVHYARTARTLFESAGLGWAWWNWDSNFPYIRRGWNAAGRGILQPHPPELRLALLPNSPLGPSVEPFALHLVIQPLPDGRRRVRLTGPAGVPLQLQSATHLNDWQTILTGGSETGELQYVTPGPAAAPIRFFRGMTSHDTAITVLP